MRNTSRIRRYAAYAALIIAIPLFGYSLNAAAPIHLARATGSMLANASVGVSAAVPPNPDNTLNAQLNEKAARLDAREAKVQAEEQKPRPPTLNDTLGMYSFFISLALFVLVALNFYFDMRRRSSAQMSTSYSVNLRS